MIRADFENLVNNRLEEKPKIYDYILKRVNKNIKHSYCYKNQVYCSNCSDVFLFDKKKADVGICPKCKRKYELKQLRAVKNDRIMYHIFSLLDYDKKNNILVCMYYCISSRFSFCDGTMKVYSDVFTIGVDGYDLSNGYKSFLFKNVYLGSYGNFRIFNFGSGARIKKSRTSFSEKSFSSSCYDVIYFVYDLFYTSCLKNKYLKYFSFEQLRIDFFGSWNLVVFVRALSIYPKLETLYKLDKCSFSEYKVYFFESLVSCLRIKGSKYQYYKFDYQLMKDIYTHKKSEFDFSYYVINIRLGKPYAYDKKMFLFFSSHISLLNRKTYNYLFKRKKNNEFSIYSDYLKMCKELDFDMKNVNVLYPKNLAEKHDEISSILSSKVSEELKSQFLELSKLYELLNFEESGYRFYVPLNSSEFKIRGNLLKQCLASAGYDERYLQKKCIIVFIDGLDHQLNNKFTLELNSSLKIVQLHGFANDINANDKQLDNLDVVRRIIDKRLSLIEKKAGKIVYKDFTLNNNIESKNEVRL